MGIDLPEKIKILIVGAGSTGLMLAIMLAEKGIPFTIIDQKSATPTHSRSIGIHPPSISIFNRLGLLDTLMEKANKVTHGEAYIGSKPMGQIDFTKVDHAHPYILTVPQYHTEAVLEKKLADDYNIKVLRGIYLTTLTHFEKYCWAVLQNKSGKIQHGLKATYIIGCDGIGSTTRTLTGIGFEGSTYPDYYMMGDFEDNIGRRDFATVHLCKEGLVESFPHGINTRRWVVKTDHLIKKPAAQQIAEVAKERTGNYPDPETNTMTSGFRIKRFIADSFFHKRAILAGDAAHVNSPIGGQGMNLGWMDADYLAEVLPDAINKNSEEPIEEYSKKRRVKANIAASRAGFNTRIGRSFNSALLRKGLVSVMVNTPVSDYFIRSFTMLDLPSRNPELP